MDLKKLHRPNSVADAVSALSALGPSAKLLAGGTWIMRAPITGQPLPKACVSLVGVDELRTLYITGDAVTIGACVTHAALADELSDIKELRALAMAAVKSANPAIRNVATIGGNLCASAFAAADLVPALLCLGAEVECVSADGAQRIALEAFLATRTTFRAGVILTRVFVARRDVSSAHVRLPLRKAGDYPVAIVSMAVGRDRKGVVADAAIAVGSVESTAKRWTSLERAIIGSPLDAEVTAQHAAVLSEDFRGREGIEAPGWYRVQVLPALVRRAVEVLGGGREST